MRMSKAVGALFAVSLIGPSTAAADVQLTIADGRVTLIAKDATVGQILAEWARIGGTNIVNVDRIPGEPITIELTSVPEQLALEVLLRSLSGYVAAPRAIPAANLSRFDRIVVMPTSVAPAPAPAPPRAAVSVQAPAQFPPQFTAPASGAPLDSVPSNRVPTVSTFPQQPQGVTPRALSPQGNSPEIGPLGDDALQAAVENDVTNRGSATAERTPPARPPSNVPTMPPTSAVPGFKPPAPPILPPPRGQTFSPRFDVPPAAPRRE